MVKSMSENAHADAYTPKVLTLISLYISYYVVIVLPQTTVLMNFKVLFFNI